MSVLSGQLRHGERRLQFDQAPVVEGVSHVYAVRSRGALDPPNLGGEKATQPPRRRHTVMHPHSHRKRRGDACLFGLSHDAATATQQLDGRHEVCREE